MRTLGLLLLFLGLLPTPVLAASSDEVYRFDKDHTSILFFIDHLGFSKMVGEFHDYDGALTYNPNHETDSSIAVTIKAASVDTDVAALDDKLRGADFFNTEKFPDISFEGTQVEETGKNKGHVHGNLTMLGVTKPVTLDVTLNKEGWNKYAGTHVMGFSITTTLKRSDFGMSAYIPAVGDEVKIVIETEMQREQKPGGPAAQKGK